MRKIKFAESEEYSCENCLHFHMLFGRVNRMKLGKIYANGWCYNKETKQPFYTANNIAYSALTALVTRNSKERVQMGSYRFIFAFGYMPTLIMSVDI